MKRPGPPPVHLLILLVFAWDATFAGAQVDEIVIHGVTPTPGAGLPADKIPYNVQSAVAEDLESAQSQSLADFLGRQMGSVSLNDAQNNPLQPDLQYRGYTASPLLGLAQGIAVYQNGVRINEPLGDTVNWDLVPQSAIHSVSLFGGTNPVFGLNALGGALAIRMKDGFNSAGRQIEITRGSFDRTLVSAQLGGTSGSWAHYLNVQYFDEDGWRDVSESSATNAYGSFGWSDGDSQLSLYGQYGDTDLLGNGAAPADLLALDREAIFTAPDRTRNHLKMISANGLLAVGAETKLSANAFYRDNETDAFNGDASEFVICELSGADRLIEGLEDDDLDDIGQNGDSTCDGQFDDVDALEVFLNSMADSMGSDTEFSLEDLTDELSGTGALSDQAINNISQRNQTSRGADVQLASVADLFDRRHEWVIGLSWLEGESSFDSVTELAGLDPDTRITDGLGSGTFVDTLATDINTSTRSIGAYAIDSIDISERLTLTLAARFNHTDIRLADQSGQRPELNGDHSFSRLNPALGFTLATSDKTQLYASYSESNRAPTPIELACNDSVFDIAVANAIDAGEDPEDVDFECRLPNAFLADPPLDDVVTRGLEAGIRGSIRRFRFHVGGFYQANQDDILFQTTGRSTGLFANVDRTLRRGLEATMDFGTSSYDVSIAYSFLRATFDDDFAVLSPNHPFADDDGRIQVRKDDRIPGLPEHSLKVRTDVWLSSKARLGIDMLYQSDQVLRGDESSQIDTLDGFAVVDLRTSYRFNENVELFARVTNLFDSDYETFGLLGESPSEVDVPLFQDFSDPRFLGPATPRGYFLGVRLSAP